MILNGFSRFAGIIAAFVVVVVLFILGFASSQAGWLMVSLFCAWPLFWAITAWTARGLRDNYQLVPKEVVRPAAQHQQPRRPARQPIPEEF